MENPHRRLAGGATGHQQSRTWTFQDSTSVEVEPPPRQLQPVHISQDRRRQRVVPEEIDGDALQLLRSDPLDPSQRLVEAELPVEVDLLPREVRHAAGRVLETQHQAALEVILGTLK